MEHRAEAPAAFPRPVYPDTGYTAKPAPTLLYKLAPVPLSATPTPVSPQQPPTPTPSQPTTAPTTSAPRPLPPRPPRRREPQARHPAAPLHPVVHLRVQAVRPLHPALQVLRRPRAVRVLRHPPVRVQAVAAAVAPPATVSSWLSHPLPPHGSAQNAAVKTRSGQTISVKSHAFAEPISVTPTPLVL